MDEQWYWDLKNNRAVVESERGPDSDVLGPYPTKQDAENWRERVEENNAAWDDADEEWDSWGDDDGDTGDPAVGDPVATDDSD